MARTGRRPGTSGSQEAILGAARAAFADRGYDGTSMRAVARDADVDPALVHHFFGSKEGLFAAAMQLPADPGPLVAAVLADGPDGLGERLVRVFLTVWEDPAGRAPLLTLVRGAVTHERSAELLRGFVVDAVLGPVAAALELPDPALRAALAGSQLVGLALVRYVVGIEPLASAPVDVVVAALAPTVQRYLTDADLASR